MLLRCFEDPLSASKKAGAIVRIISLVRLCLLVQALTAAGAEVYGCGWCCGSFFILCDCPRREPQNLEAKNSSRVFDLFIDSMPASLCYYASKTLQYSKCLSKIVC